MKLRSLLPVVLALALGTTLSSCSKDNATTNATSQINGTMTAKVNGTAWSANFTLNAKNSGGMLAVTGDQTASGQQSHIQFNLVTPTNGTYSFGGFSANSGIYSTFPIGTTDVSVITQAQESASTGSVVVTSQTAERVTGTFQFTTTKGTTITEGNFDVKF